MDATFSAIENQTILELKAKEPGRYIKYGHNWNQRHIRTAYCMFRYRFLMVDGTKVRLQEVDKKGHGKREFPYILYADKLKKPQQEQFKNKLKSIPAMNITQSDLEKLTPDDLPKVKELANKTEQGFKELIEVLPEDKYPKARRYIENLSNNVTTFFDMWFDNKTWIPLNTNAIESAFSQVKNRIWAIGKRWSEKGLMNWLKVVVKKIFFPDSWNKVWSEYLDLDSKLQFNLLEVKYQWA